MTQGWLREGDIVFINPRIYLEQYLKAFDRSQGGMVYLYDRILDTDEKLENAKQRFLSKYTEAA